MTSSPKRDPTQVITWLGIVLDTYEGSEYMSVTESRIFKVKSHTGSMLGTPDCMAVYARFFWLTVVDQHGLQTTQTL